MSQHDRTPQPKNPPRTEKKKQKMEADRGVWLAECKEKLKTMEPNDLAGMFGLLGNMIVDRIHDSQMNIIRCEHFGPALPSSERHEENMDRLYEQLERYQRYLGHVAVFGKLLKTFEGEESLQKAIRGWADTLSV